MRRLVWAACLSAVATASAGPVPRRPPKDTPIEMMRALIEAITLDRWGQVMEADQKYDVVGDLFWACSGSVKHCDKAKAAPPAAIAVMLLDAALHNIQLDIHVASTKMLKRYLELAPDAANRADVAQLRTELESPDRIVTIGGSVLRGAKSEVDAIILIDGVVVGSSPVTTTVKSGLHVAERITKSSYAGQLFEHHKNWEPAYMKLDSSDEATGNVLISGDLAWAGCTMDVGRKCHAWTWRSGAREFAVARRFSLPVGHYRVTAGDLTCKPFELDVRSAKQLSYVRVEGKRTDKGGCFDVTNVSTQILEVPSP